MDRIVSDAGEPTEAAADRAKREAAWLEENRKAIEEYNARIAREGLLLEDLHRF